MLNKKIIGENFSRAAKNYDQVAIVQKQAAQKLCQLASPFINDDSRILDLGCGTGFIAQNLSQKIFECDLSFAMLQQPRNGHKIQCDFTNLPFKKNSFDLLISSFSLQWLEDFETYFANFSALLKPQGILAFCLPTYESLQELKSASAASDCNFHFNILLKNSDLKSALKNCRFSEKLFVEEIVKSKFESGLQAIKSIKETGANYRGQNSFITKNRLNQFNNFCLKNFADESKKISISWNISFFICQKS